MVWKVNPWEGEREAALEDSINMQSTLSEQQGPRRVLKERSPGASGGGRGLDMSPVATRMSRAILGHEESSSGWTRCLRLQAPTC